MTLEVPRSDPEAAKLVDRRRPGRPLTVHSKLLPLLRAEERARLPELIDDRMDPTPDDIETFAIGELRDRHPNAGEGIALAVGLGVVMWIAIIAAGRAVIEHFR